ncbi:hypothetical protein FDECE_1941 [Fusarium decemcellulare]|nr:hypothetical protein FDECE_1941 [Fusarium decemcellulare]
MPSAIMLALKIALKTIAAIGISLCVIVTQSAGPAPFAAPELGLLARAQYYMFHRRCRDLFLGFSIGDLVFCALEGWPPTPPGGFSRATGVAAVALLHGLGASLLTAYENRDTSADGE